jgi:hypothetical protein
MQCCCALEGEYPVPLLACCTSVSFAFGMTKHSIAFRFLASHALVLPRASLRTGGRFAFSRKFPPARGYLGGGRCV